jgi:hypothetical protein
VFLDGETEGPTPFQRRIFDPTRAYALSVRKEGYEPHERMISASDAWVKIRGEYQLTITVKLRKLAGAGAASAPEGGDSTGTQEATPEAKPEPTSAPVLDP